MVDMPSNPTKPNQIYLIYMYKEDLALNNLNGWYVIKPNQTKFYKFNIYMYKEDLALNNPHSLICHKTQPNQIIYI